MSLDEAASLRQHAADMYDADTSFWDARAELGKLAGTQDRIAKELEIRYLSARVGEWDRCILDAGCGDGETLAWLGTPGSLGFDSSPKMLELARAKSSEVAWALHDVREPFPVGWGRFPVVYTERSLINLKNWYEQRLAIQNLKRAVESGGLLVCVEACWESLGRLNILRRGVGLVEIMPPAHDRYLSDGSMAGEGFTIHRFTDTYYFMSRIANACLAQASGREPEYDSPINALARDLPNAPEMRCGQVVAWEWRAP